MIANKIYYLVLESLIEEAELNEFSSVGGVSVPLGAGPRGRVAYRSGNDKSDSAYKRKSKKRKKSKKSKSRSVQYYLKHGW